MIRSQQVVPNHKSNGKNLAMLIASIAGLAKMEEIDYDNPKVRQASTRIEALEPAVIYLRNKRKENIRTPADFDKMLLDIQEGKISSREKLGLAKIFDSNRRIGAILTHGIEGITGKNFRPSLAFMMNISDDSSEQEIEAWVNDPQVQEIFGEYQSVIAKYFEAKSSYVS